MYKIGFIVLHYKLLDVTSRCIDSILNKYGSYNIFILIVDNGSNDNSGFALDHKYKENKNVEVIILEKNEGFSVGNNKGYEFMRKKGYFDYMIVCNNDLIFEQKDFFVRLPQIYDRTKFSVLGPDIRNVNGSHQSPILMKGRTLDEIERYLKECSNVLKKIDIYVIKKKLSSKFIKLYDIYYKHKKRRMNRIDYSLEYRNPVIHGSCMILSKEFIKKNDKIFTPEVFFYNEEEILWYRQMSEGQTIIYSPQLYVIHDHSRATNAVKKTEREHIMFEMGNYIKSGEVLYEMIKQGEHN